MSDRMKRVESIANALVKGVIQAMTSGAANTPALAEVASTDWRRHFAGSGLNVASATVADNQSG